MEPNAVGQPVKTKRQRKRVASKNLLQTTGERKATTIVKPKASLSPQGAGQRVPPKPSRAKREAAEQLVPERIAEMTSKSKQGTRAGEPSAVFAEHQKAQPRGRGKAVKAAATADPTEMAKPNRKGKASAEVQSSVESAVRPVTENAKKPSTQEPAAKRPRKDQAPGKAGLEQARSRRLESEHVTAFLGPSFDEPLISKMADCGSEPRASKHLDSVPGMSMAKPKRKPPPLKSGIIGRTKADVQRGYYVDVPPPYRIRKRTKGANEAAGSNGRSDGVWCEACRRQYNGDCADAGHRPSSMRLQQQGTALQDVLRELQELRKTLQGLEGRLGTVENQQQTMGSAVPPPTMELNLWDMSVEAGGGELRKERNDLLLGDRLDRARKVTGLCCAPNVNWSEAVLRRVGPRVEELYVRLADYQHLRALQGMAALRKLNLTCLLRDDHCQERDEAVPMLPLQLEDLRVRNFKREHLLSVEWMPRLRRLELVDGDGPVEAPSIDFASAPAHCGLERLEVHVKNLSTVVSLVRAHAATLRELHVRCSSRPTGEWSCPDLPGKLQRSKLAALRRLVLCRKDPPSRDDHGSSSCSEQLDDFRARLEADVVVECSKCGD